MNFVSMIHHGAFSTAYWAKASLYALSPTVVTASIDVNELLSGDGAAGEGGALEHVNEQVKNYGRGGFTIMQNLAIYTVAIMMLAGAVALAFHAGNPNKRDEDKNALIWRFVAGVLAFAGIAILVFAQKIGSVLFN